MNRPSIVVLSLLITTITLLVGSRLLMSVNPNYMFQEQYGLAYNFAPRLGALCDPNPLAGLEGPTSNVTDQRSLSLLYVVPTKLFRHSFDLYSLHRIIGVIFFGATLFALLGLASTLGLSFLPSALLIATVGLSTQLISYLYESKLTITSTAWFATTLWCIAALERSLREERHRRAAFLFFIFPILAAFSYETYTVSRPLAVVVLLLIGGYRLWCADTRGHRLKFATLFMLSTALAGGILRALHPGIRFDQTLFEGRTESLVTPRGELFHAWKETISTRVSEIPAIFNWSPNYFSSETASEAGSLELWLALLIVTFVTVLVISGPSLRTREAIEQHRRFYLILFLLSGVALTIPLLSITYIRGHRLFGLYIILPIFLSALIAALRSSELRTVRIGAAIFSLGCIGVLFVARIPLVLGWSPPAHFTLPYAKETIEALKTLPLPEHFSPTPDSVLVRVCDQANPPSWEHFWNAALYVSDYGCRVGGATTRLDCDCESREGTDGLRGIVCITRISSDKDIALTTRYIPAEPN